MKELQERKLREFYARRRAETDDPEELQKLRDAEEDDIQTLEEKNNACIHWSTRERVQS